jgi:hypothetical protein
MGFIEGNESCPVFVVPLKVAEELERDLAAVWRERSAFAKRIDKADAELAQRLVAQDALATELAALKAHDPLAEMWRELEAYQPQADRDGHGDSWRRMCAERTKEAAHAAAWARGASLTASEWSWASRAADAAARAATEAAICAQRAIAAIRRAKEGQR